LLLALLQPAPAGGRHGHDHNRRDDDDDHDDGHQSFGDMEPSRDPFRPLGR